MYDKKLPENFNCYKPSIVEIANKIDGIIYYLAEKEKEEVCVGPSEEKETMQSCFSPTCGNRMPTFGSTLNYDFIFCGKCGVRGPEVHGMEDAIKLWNEVKR